jgi:outer membrane lipoprotein
MKRLGLLLLAGVVLAGCSTLVPPDLRDRFNRRLKGPEILGEPGRYRGQVVMMGGEIIGVRNTPDATELELLERPLEDEEPMLSDRSAGRFLARQPGFLDPAVYEVGRRVTVVGIVADPVDRKIGEVDHRYAVLDARRIQLWPERYYGHRYPPPYWAHPYWGFYSYWGYPYWYDPFWAPRRLKR